MRNERGEILSDWGSPRQRGRLSRTRSADFSFLLVQRWKCCQEIIETCSGRIDCEISLSLKSFAAISYIFRWYGWYKIALAGPVQFRLLCSVSGVAWLWI